MRRIGLAAPSATVRGSCGDRFWNVGLDFRLGRLDRGSDAARGLRGSGLPDVLDELDAVILEDALRAPDRVTLAVQEMTDAAQEIDIVRPVVAAAAAAL